MAENKGHYMHKVKKVAIIIIGDECEERDYIVKIFKEKLGDYILEIKFDEFEGAFDQIDAEELLKEQEDFLILTDIYFETEDDKINFKINLNKCDIDVYMINSDEYRHCSSRKIFDQNVKREIDDIFDSFKCMEFIRN